MERINTRQIPKSPQNPNVFKQNLSPIAPEVPEFGGPGHLNLAREIQVPNNRNLERVAKSMCDALHKTQVDALKNCIEELSLATKEEIYFVLTYESQSGNNRLLEAINGKSPEALQLVCNLCEQLPTDSLSTLILPTDDLGSNCLIQVIMWQNLEMLQPVCSLFQRLSLQGTIIQDLLLQQDQFGDNCLLAAISSKNLEIIQLVWYLCKQVLQDRFQDLLFQQNRAEKNFLLRALFCKDLEVLKLVCNLCDQLPENSIQTLLLQKDKGKRSCLSEAIESGEQAILKLIIGLYDRVDSQILKNAMQGLGPDQKERVECTRVELKQKYTKRASNT